MSNDWQDATEDASFWSDNFGARTRKTREADHQREATVIPSGRGTIKLSAGPLRIVPLLISCVTAACAAGAIALARVNSDPTEYFSAAILAFIAAGNFAWWLGHRRAAILDDKGITQVSGTNAHGGPIQFVPWSEIFAVREAKRLGIRYPQVVQFGGEPFNLTSVSAMGRASRTRADEVSRAVSQIQSRIDQWSRFDGAQPS